MIHDSIGMVDRPVSFTLDDGARVEPVTLEAVKLHARISTSAEDTLLQALIGAARGYFENQTGRGTIDAVWEWAMDAAPAHRVIEVPRPPLVSVESITYTDVNGDDQTLDADTYRVIPSILQIVTSPATPVAVDPMCPCGRIELVAGARWPSTSGRAAGLRIRRVCGYGETPAAMPPMLQVALYLLVGHFYRHREEVTDEPVGMLPLGAEAILNEFKRTALVAHKPRPRRDELTAHWFSS